MMDSVSVCPPADTNKKAGRRWNVNAGLFTVVVIGIIVAGTLWVMWNMNYHMMH